jgi:CRISPR-associated exonuclease Cas4
VVGIDSQGAILHYPTTRRTHREPYTTKSDQDARTDIQNVLDVVAAPASPTRLARTACRGCSFTDYCWME